jgi:hypothetical protein
MSYSIGFTARDKQAAKAQVQVEMEQIVASQPTHQADAQQALAAAHAFIDILTDDATRDISVSVAGSLSWNWDTPPDAPKNFNGANLSIGVYYVERKA